MKLIDRYVARGFLVRFVVAYLVVFGLFVSFDALKRIEELQEGPARQVAAKLLAYYAYQFPVAAMDVVPPLLLLAAGLMLVQMARNGELLTLKASGISLQRVAGPVFLCSVPVVALVWWAGESVVPRVVREQELIQRELASDVSGPFLLRDEREGWMLFVGSYDFARHRVSIQGFEPSGALSGSVEVLRAREVQTSLRPYDLVLASKDVMSVRMLAFSTAELKRRSASNPHNVRLRVMLQARRVAPFVPFALLLAGIPVLVGFEQTMRSRLLGVLVCIMLMAGFQVLSFICLGLGNAGALHPVLAAWLPVGLTGGVGAWLFGTMHT